MTPLLTESCHTGEKRRSLPPDPYLVISLDLIIELLLVANGGTMTPIEMLKTLLYQLMEMIVMEVMMVMM